MLPSGRASAMRARGSRSEKVWTPEKKPNGDDIDESSKE
jgi:hypothetical protein